MGWSEDALHRWLAERPPPDVLVGGAQHDAAVLERLTGAPVLCADQCVLGVHAHEDVEPGRFGAKAVLRTASDLAAAAARPVAFTLALRAPASETDERLREVVRGAADAAREVGGWLVAGDLTGGAGALGATVTALGAFDGAGQPPARGRATAGETVLVSGPLGGSLASERHLSIAPRIDAGVAAHRAGASALMDVSDGLAWDLYRLARTAGVAIEVDTTAVPVHPDAARAAATDGRRSALHRALHDGEDHELIATIAPAALADAGEALAGWTEIGRVVAGEGLALVGADGARRTWRRAMGGFGHGDTGVADSGTGIGDDA